METPHLSNPSWNTALEQIIKKEAEQAESLYKLHYRSQTITSKKNDYLAIPAIVFGVIGGFLTGGASEMISPFVLGGISIVVAVLNTITNYYKFASKAEGHRVAAIYYLKLYKTLEIELSLPADQRTPAEDLLKSYKEQLSRVSETAPQIDEQAIREHKPILHASNVSAPLVANGLEQVKIYKEVGALETPRHKINIRLDAPPAVANPSPKTRIAV